MGGRRWCLCLPRCRFAWCADRRRGVLPERPWLRRGAVAGASALTTLPWLVLFSRRQRALRAVLAMVLVAIPPIGIVGWAHLITAAGELAPGGAWLGLVATFVGLSLSARWPLLAVAMVVVAMVMPKSPIEAPDGWRGVQTHWLMTSGQHRLVEQHERLVALAEQVAANDTDRVLIFPETILGSGSCLPAGYGRMRRVRRMHAVRRWCSVRNGRPMAALREHRWRHGIAMATCRQSIVS